MKYTLLGSNSGRNAGDAAILSAVIDEFSRVDPDAEFFVPTTNMEFVRRSYAHLDGRVRPVNILPYTGSVRLLGPTTMAAMARSDATLICDGIIFDVRLFNPAFNFLITLVGLAPGRGWYVRSSLATAWGSARCGRPPGRRFTRWVGKYCREMLVRETDSRDLLLASGVDPSKVSVWADVAYVTRPAAPERVDRILSDLGLPLDEPLVGVNVTRYIGDWVATGGLDQAGFLEQFREVFARLRERLAPARLILICTQRMDLGFAQQLREAIGDAALPILINDPALEDGTGYDCHDLMGVMGRLELFIGMRLHSLILASAMKTPIVGIVYAPKVASLLSWIGLPDNQVALTREGLQSLVEVAGRAWDARAEQKAVIDPRIDEMRESVRGATQRVRAHLDGGRG